MCLLGVLAPRLLPGPRRATTVCESNFQNKSKALPGPHRWRMAASPVIASEADEMRSVPRPSWQSCEPRNPVSKSRCCPVRHGKALRAAAAPRSMEPGSRVSPGEGRCGRSRKERPLESLFVPGSLPLRDLPAGCSAHLHGEKRTCLQFGERQGESLSGALRAARSCR